MLLDLDNELFAVGSLHNQGIMNPWEMFALSVREIEMYIYDRADDLGNPSCDI
jgi:hypothetical protein